MNDDINEVDVIDTAKLRSKAEPSFKVKLQLALEEEHPLARLANTVKARGVKDLNVGEEVAAALLKVPSDYWDRRIDDLTPLEFRINYALNDPAMREKISMFLNKEMVN